MIRELLDAIRENKKLAVFIIAGLAALLALLVAWIVTSSPARSKPASDAVQPPAAEAAAEEAQEVVVLGELQRALAKTTPHADALILGVLQANTWVNPAGTSTLDFSGNVFTERTGGEAARTSFVAVDIYEEAGTVLEDGVAVEEGTWLIDCVGAGGDFFFLRVYRVGTGPDTDMVVSSPAFRGGSYIRVAPTDNVVIEGLGEEAAALIDGKTEMLGFVLCDYCALNYPTATRAAYGGSSNVDFAKGTVEMSFTIDNAARTTLKVTYDLASGTFKVGR